MSRLNILGRGFRVFKKIVRRFDGIRAATQLGKLRPGWTAIASAIVLTRATRRISVNFRKG